MGVKTFFEFYCPVKIISGRLALANLPYEMEQLGARRAMVVTDRGVKGAGLMKYLENALEGSNCGMAAVFEDTPPDSSMSVVNQVAQLYRDKNCDCFVAVGGGSCIDTAKCANIVVSEGTGDLVDFQGADRIKKQLKPLLVVPTTAGTGSEVTLVAVIYDEKTNTKLAFTSDRLNPSVAILDPRMTLTMPPKITAATGMDALTHAVEAYYCLAKNPVSDAFAAAAVKLIMGNLVKCVRDGNDEEARLAMANGSLLAGIAFSNSMVGVVHSLAHGAGGVVHIPHGVANAIFLPWGMEYNIGRRAEIIAELAPLLCGREAGGSAGERAAAAVRAVRDLAGKLNEICGLPLRLRDAGVKEDSLEAIAKAAINDGSLVYNPEEVTFEEALELLKKAW